MWRPILVGLVFAATVPSVGRSASLSVAPTRVELGPGDPAGVVTLQNNAAEPVMVQVQTFAWPRTAASDDLEPTRELLAVPPVAELPGNGKQIIRVALRASLTGNREHAYRLLITEVPRGGSSGTGVRIALRLSLPVFVTPPGAAPKPVWSLRQEQGIAHLVLVNDGNAYLQVRRIVLHAPGRPTPAQTIESPAYILAGQEHSWPLPAGTAATTLQLEAETNVGPLPATVVLPRG
ncbi:MAG: molecular chaperone [Geminicoccaceae bacterium]